MPKLDPSLFPENDPIRYGSARRRERLFLPAYVNEAAIKQLPLNDADIERSHGVFRDWAALELTGKLRSKKEDTLRGEFLTRVFGEGLGYGLLSDNTNQWDLEPEYGVNGGEADAAIGWFPGSQPDALRAVVEVKGPTVDVDRDRLGGRTPVQQLWDYLAAAPECEWGILTNMVSFRLYHRNRTPHRFEHVALQELVDFARFKRFYVLFSRLGLLPRRRGEKSAIDNLLTRTDTRQKEVGDKLYEHYSVERLALIHHLHREQKRDVDTAIRITQRLLDRIMFVAFCEDRSLLPERCTERAWTDIPPFSKVTNPRWQSFRDLFRSIDGGNVREGITAFNGGLFRFDPEVDDLELDDNWTNFFKAVGEYDFRDEVNVEVLGHLFEKSVTELERLRSGGLFEAITSNETASAQMPKSALRKRSGIYYTPREFTELIVRLTISATLDERFDVAARRHDIDPDSPNNRQDRDDHLGYQRECLAILRSLRVCDPACGSGAFLIRAYDALEERYDAVVERLRALGESGADALARNVPDLILSRNLFGVDLSPEAVEITQLALWIRSARTQRTLADLSANVCYGNSLVNDPALNLDAFRWHERFPDVFGGDEPGFDCVIGNPPWERIKLQEREFFSLSAPNIAAAVNAANRRKLIAALEEGNPELYRRYLTAKEQAERMLDYVRASGRYPLMGKGDVNLYAVFTELARTIVAPRGRIGLLVPSGIATDATTQGFFNDLIESHTLHQLYDFENKKPYFVDVHRSFKFSTIIMGGASCTREVTDFVFFAHEVDELKDPKRHVPLTAKDMALLNPNTRTCPVFRSRRDADLTRAIYNRIPILIDHNRKEGGNPWGIRFMRMFDQTNAAELFHTAEQLKKMGLKRDGARWSKGQRVFLPLYEAKMVQMYDHRAASVIVDEDNWMRQGQTESTSLVKHQNPEYIVEPRWWVDQAEVDRALEGCAASGLLAFKDVTSPTNQRTMIASFIPRCGVLNSAPLALTGDDVSVRLECCLLANLNSFALDFVARQKVGNVHLNFFIVEQLPVLPPDAYKEKCPWNKRLTLERWISDRVLKLTCTAEDMAPLAEAAGFEKRIYKWDPTERAKLMAELDAAYFHLYGLSRDDVEYLLSTFSVASRRDELDFGVTALGELILGAYDILGS